jgi:hypothetical protein
MFVARTLGEPAKSCRNSGQLMTRMLTSTWTGVVMFAGAQVIAANAMRQSTMGKRQMAVQVIRCVKERTSVNKDISYNAAAKVPAACRCL